MRRFILPLVVLSVAATGCATKKYVSREVGEVNQKVDNLSGEVEKTQERVKTHRDPHRLRGQAVADRHRRGQGLGERGHEQGRGGRAGGQGQAALHA